MRIKADSRKVTKGDIFIALGKGHNYINDAINNGAETIICENGMYNVSTIIVPDTRKYLEEYLKLNYYNLIKDVKLIGITGTNGKTTSCYLIYQALNLANKKCGYIGTIGFYIDGKVNDLNNTTPDLIELYEMILECKKNNCEYVVMEVSSHALEYGRVNTLLFDYCVFTNLTIDHLDYHQNMENYALAKKKLFALCRGKSIINGDSEYKNYYISDNSITYGFMDNDYRITDYEISVVGSKFKVNDVLFESSLIGKYNLYNLLVLIIILNELGIDNVFEIVKNVKAPIGRMDKIEKDSNIIIVDYAHTPDAVLNIIETCKLLNHNHIYTIIGCGGNRDKSKRSIMGKISTENSDYVIFTNDNPRFENENDIMNDILQNIDKTNYEIILNREKAIIKGIHLLEENDILLVLGKGHENYQIINGVRNDFDDKKVVLDNL